MKLTGLNKSITNALGRLAPKPTQPIASQAQQSPTRSLVGMGAAMRSGSGLTPMPVASQSGSATGITPPPGGAGLASTPAQQMQGLLQGRPVGISGMGNAMRGGNALIPNPVASQTQTPSLMSGFGQPIARVPGQTQTPSLMSGFGQPIARVPGMKKGGSVKNKTSSKTYKSGGSVSSASKRADGCAVKGKTRGKMV